MFSSAARSVLQVALGVQIFGDVVTTQRATSVLTILVGTLMYTWVKSRETQHPPDTKEPVLPMTSLHNTRSTSKLLEPGGGLSDKERSISDSGEIFAMGAHDEEANVHTRTLKS